MSDKENVKPDLGNKPTPTPSEQITPTEIKNGKINEGFEKGRLNAERDVQKGFDFEAKPTRPPEKPKTDSKGTE